MILDLTIGLITDRIPMHDIMISNILIIFFFLTLIIIEELKLILTLMYKDFV